MKIIRPAFLAALFILSIRWHVNAQAVDDIIRKNVATTGGIDRWKRINSMKLVGTGSGNGAKFSVTATELKMKGMRFEFTMNGKTGYTIITKTSGWTLNPFVDHPKPQPMSEEQVRMGKDALDLEGDLIDYKLKGNTVTFAGTDTIGDAGCYKLKIVLPNGKEETQYIDSLSFYLLRSFQKWTENGQTKEQTTDFSNFTLLDAGITIPMTISSGMGLVTFKKAEVNKPVNENIFKP